MKTGERVAQRMSYGLWKFVYPNSNARALGTIALLLLSSSALAVALVYGPITTSDGVRDIQFARILMESGYSPFALDARTRDLRIEYEMPQSPISYLIYLVYLSVADMFMGERWAIAVTVVNSIMFTTSNFILLVLIFKLLKEYISVSIMFMLLLFNWEYVQWVSMTQSECLYFLFSTISAMLMYYTLQAGDRFDALRRGTLTMVAVLACAFVRPTVVPLIASLLSLPALAWVFHADDPSTISWRFRVFLSVTLGAIFATILVHAWVLFTLPEWLWTPVLDLAEFLRPYHAEGWVVWVRPETYTKPPTSVLEFAWVSVLRLVYFFWFMAGGFSFGHALINILTFIPLYSLAIFGFIEILSKNNKYIYAHEKKWGMICILYILYVDAYHAITILDFDWRYRAVTYWALFSLAAIGAKRVLRWIRPLPVSPADVAGA